MKNNIFFLLAINIFISSLLYSQSPVVTAQVGYPVGQSADEAAYGNSIYLILSANNQYYKSSDAVSWSPSMTTGVTATNLNSLAFGAGLFVSVGDAGLIQSSPDGITWTTRTSGTSERLGKVYFVNSKFLAIGNKRTLLSSADGINWSVVTFNAGSAAHDFMSLSFGNGVYVLAARDNGSGTYNYRSATATSGSWTYYSQPFGFESINRVEFLNNKFWAFTVGNLMYTTADGITWTNITASIQLTQPDLSVIGWTNSHQIFNGIYDGSKYIFYGSSAYLSGYGSSFVSTDGVNFTLLNKTAYIVPQESVILNGIYFVTGNEGFVTSADGLTYAHSGSSYNDLVKTASKYIAAGYISSDGQIYNSPDFISWTKRTPANARELYTVATDGSTVLAAGYLNVYKSTNNGDSWTSVYTGANTTFSCMTWGNSRFITAGYDVSGYFIRTSTDDGVSWTTVNTDNIYVLKMKKVNNGYFALGQDGTTYLGRVLYSTDGISWSDITPVTAYEVLYYKDVTWDGTKYHLLGVESSSYTPTGFFTLSTSTPSVAASYSNKAVCSNIPVGVVLGGNWDQGLLDYSNGKFTGAVIDVTTGQDYLIYSTDGNSWTCQAQQSYSSMIASVTDAGVFKMAGRSNAFFSVSYGGTLPVHLLSFTGKKSAMSSMLKWIVSEEVNVKNYIVERCQPGANWESIGSVSATANGIAGNTSYSFTDDQPLSGINQYRLRQVDFDGRETYSTIVSLNFSVTTTIQLYPNPARDQLQVKTSASGSGTILISNAAGIAVLRTGFTGSGRTLDISRLPAGHYLLQLITGPDTVTVPFIKAD
jgi:Secretion system C-terminal sorting domain